MMEVNDGMVYAEKTYAVMNGQSGNFWLIMGTDKKHYIVSTDPENQTVLACKELNDITNFELLKQKADEMEADYLKNILPLGFNNKDIHKEITITSPTKESWLKKIFKKKKTRGDSE